MKQLEKHNNHIRIRVTVLLRRKDGKICFARHCKAGKRYWLLPGGGQDLYEPAMATAAREIAEELCIKAESYKLLFVRESMDETSGRHIQFLVFEGLHPDFSTIDTGHDERVEGFDFFGPSEIADAKIYPSMREDLLKFAQGEELELFKTLDWIP